MIAFDFDETLFFTQHAWELSRRVHDLQNTVVTDETWAEKISRYQTFVQFIHHCTPTDVFHRVLPTVPVEKRMLMTESQNLLKVEALLRMRQVHIPVILCGVMPVYRAGVLRAYGATEYYDDNVRTLQRIREAHPGIELHLVKGGESCKF